MEKQKNGIIRTIHSLVIILTEIQFHFKLDKSDCWCISFTMNEFDCSRQMIKIHNKTRLCCSQSTKYQSTVTLQTALEQSSIINLQKQLHLFNFGKKILISEKLLKKKFFEHFMQISTNTTLLLLFHSVHYKPIEVAQFLKLILPPNSIFKESGVFTRESNPSQ